MASGRARSGGGGGDPATVVTIADALAVPPDPVQARLKVLVLVKTPVDWLPEVALAPDHWPEAVQEVASVDDQVSVDDPPLVIDVGFVASDTVGSVAAAFAGDVADTVGGALSEVVVVREVPTTVPNNAGCPSPPPAPPQPNRPRLANRDTEKMPAQIPDLILPFHIRDSSRINFQDH